MAARTRMAITTQWGDVTHCGRAAAGIVRTDVDDARSLFGDAERRDRCNNVVALLMAGFTGNPFF